MRHHYKAQFVTFGPSNRTSIGKLPSTCSPSPPWKVPPTLKSTLWRAAGILATPQSSSAAFLRSSSSTLVSDMSVSRFLAFPWVACLRFLCVQSASRSRGLLLAPAVFESEAASHLLGGAKHNCSSDSILRPSSPC